MDENEHRNCLNTYELIPFQNCFLLKSNEVFGNDDTEYNKIPGIMNLIYKEIINKNN